MNVASRTKLRVLKPALALAALGSVLALGGAQAQIGGQGQGPVAVTSAEFEYVGNVAVYRGQVQAIQGQTRLNCSELRIIFPASSTGQVAGGGGDADRYECSGPVYYVTPTEQAKANAGVFTASNNTIVLTGDVTVRQGQNVAQGQRLTINTRTRNSRLESAGSSPRVRTVIYPDQPAPAAPSAR
jgi:lipopolysaccharide export system protein LptA